MRLGPDPFYLSKSGKMKLITINSVKFKAKGVYKGWAMFTERYGIVLLIVIDCSICIQSQKSILYVQLFLYNTSVAQSGTARTIVEVWFGRIG